MSQNRITTPFSSLIEVIVTLTDGNPGAKRVLMEWIKGDKLAVMGLLHFDTKRLYGHQIWELYSKVCGQDIERFRYHVAVELPNQETGELSVSGPYSPLVTDKEFWEKRRFGRPNSFWALENPPTDPNYEYPIA